MHKPPNIGVGILARLPEMNFISPCYIHISISESMIGFGGRQQCLADRFWCGANFVLRSSMLLLQRGNCKTHKWNNTHLYRAITDVLMLIMNFYYVYECIGER